MQSDFTDTPQYAVIELIVVFVCSLALALLYQRFSGSSAFGQYPYSGAAVVLAIVSLFSAWSAQDSLKGWIRAAVPIGLLVVFAFQGPTSLGLVERLQSRIDLLHFVFLFAATFFAVLFTAGVPKKLLLQQVKDHTKPQPQRRPPPRPDAKAFDRIVGQESVVQSLEELAGVVRSGIRVGKRNAPHAVLLFLGPTGVGKTEAARALASAVYGSDEALIRFDMGQFTDAHQANRFYGPPPGYVGSDKGGQLTQSVLKKSRSVVLLDEVEKAHPQIWDAFLPVFDEGYIVDGSTNQKVDMTNTIIVLTSNLLVGREGLMDLDAAELKDALRETGAFRPELIGRINDVLIFKPLSNEVIAEILRRRVDASLWSLSDQGISIFVDDDDIETMVAEVKEAKYGVRQIDDVVRKFLRHAITEQQASPQAD